MAKKFVHYVVHQADLKTWGWIVCGVKMKKKWATRKRANVTCPKCIRMTQYDPPYQGTYWRLTDDGWEEIE